MPGPLPKDPKIRQRTNRSASRALLPAELSPLEATPRLPKCPDERGWHRMARRWWSDVWTSPMHFEYLRGDRPGLELLAALVNDFWWTGSLAVAKEIRLREREFGLTPLSRRRLEWSVAQAEEAKDRHEHRRISRAEIIEVDPRILEG